MPELGPVVLSDEEADECQQMIRMITEEEDGEWVVKKEFAEEFQRGIIAFCLMGRADRFLSEAGGSAVHITFHIPYYSPDATVQEDLAEKACISAAKACAIYPIPIYFYDFGCILYQLGKNEDAIAAFQQFISHHETVTPEMQLWLRTRDVESALRMARELVS